MRKFSIQVLIVEDDKILSDTIKQCIKGKYSVEQAYDGQEGVLFATHDMRFWLNLEKNIYIHLY